MNPQMRRLFIFTGFSLSMALVSPALEGFQGVSRDGHALRVDCVWGLEHELVIRGRVGRAFPA